MARRAIHLALMLLPMFASTTSAELVTHSFSGTITTITQGGQNGTPIAGLGGVDVGDSFTGSFTYDTAEGGTDRYPTDPNRGWYFFNPTTTNTVSLNIDGQVFDTPNGSTSSVDTYDNFPTTLSSNSDALYISKVGPNLPAGWSAGSATSLASILYIDATGTALPSDALPTSFQESDWDQGIIVVQFLDDVITPTGTFNNIYIEGTITVVPEPATWVLVSVALLIGVCSRVRRRKC